MSAAAVFMFSCFLMVACSTVDVKIGRLNENADTSSMMHEVYLLPSAHSALETVAKSLEVDDIQNFNSSCVNSDAGCIGLTGPFSISETGDRYCAYEQLSMKDAGLRSFKVIGTFDESSTLNVGFTNLHGGSTPGAPRAPQSRFKRRRQGKRHNFRRRSRRD